MKHTGTLGFFICCLLGSGSACLGQTASSALTLESAAATVSDSDSYQMVRIKGVVKGPKGPLPGAIVQVKNTQVLAVSAANGKFELEIPTPAATVELVCSYAGLADEVVKLAANEKNAVIKMLKPVPRTTAEPVLESGWW